MTASTVSHHWQATKLNMAAQQTGRQARWMFRTAKKRKVKMNSRTMSRMEDTSWTCAVDVLVSATRHTIPTCPHSVSSLHGIDASSVNIAGGFASLVGWMIRTAKHPAGTACLLCPMWYPGRTRASSKVPAAGPARSASVEICIKPCVACSTAFVRCLLARGKQGKNQDRTTTSHQQ